MVARPSSRPWLTASVAGAPLEKTGSRKCSDLVVAADGVRDADPSADDGEKGEDHERDES